jgi:hypothetical protein
VTGEERERRDSRALEPQLITDPQEKAAAEARNGFRQYDAAIGAIQTALEQGAFKLRPSLILGLQHAADSACRAGRIDVSKMEELLGALLANQLAEFSKSAGGKLPG